MSSSATKPVVDPAKLVFWIDILLLGVLGIITAVVFPRRLRRFVGVGDWRRGLVLYESSKNLLRTNSSADSNTTLLSRNSLRNRKFNAVIKSLFLPGTSSRMMHKFLYMWRTPIIPGYSSGRIILMMLYFGVLLFAATFRDSVFTNPVRDAWIAVSQLPFVFALATKNNVLSVLLGIGYEKLNWLHRFAGRLVVLAANVHAIGFIYKWTLQGVWTERLQEVEFRWGLVALVSFDILFLFSLRVFRQLSYNFFFFTHLVGLIVVIIAISFHQAASRPYTIIAASLYIADRIIRAFKSHIVSAHIECVPEIGSTVLRVSKLNAGWRAGQHVRVRVLSVKMGMLGWTEMHPYTIASASGVGEQGLTLLVKKTGDWSKQLYAVAEDGDNDSWPNKGTAVTVHIDGPYGGPGNTVFSSFSGALFLVGGSGITFALAAVREMMRQATEKTAQDPGGYRGVNIIEIVWSVQHARSVTPLLSLFTSLLQRESSAASSSDDMTAYRPCEASYTSSNTKYLMPKVTISVYYTRALTHLDARALRLQGGSARRRSGRLAVRHESGDHLTSPTFRDPRPHRPQETTFVDEDDHIGHATDIFPPGLTVHASRPRAAHVLNDFLDRTMDTLPSADASDAEKQSGVFRGRGIVIGVCGPRSMADDARLAIGDMDDAKRRCVGGVELVEEVFHW